MPVLSMSSSINFLQLSFGIAGDCFVFVLFHELCLFGCYSTQMLKMDHHPKTGCDSAST